MAPITEYRLAVANPEKITASFLRMVDAYVEGLMRRWLEFNTALLGT